MLIIHWPSQAFELLVLTTDFVSDDCSLSSNKDGTTLLFFLLSFAHALGHVGEETVFLGGEIGEGTLLDDLAIIDDSQTGAFLDSRQPVGDDNRSAVLHDFVEGLLNQSLGLFIESRCGLVEKKDLRLTNDGSSDRDSLLLTTGELASAGASEDAETRMETFKFSLLRSVSGIDQISDRLETSLGYGLRFKLAHEFEVSVEPRLGFRIVVLQGDLSDLVVSLFLHFGVAAIRVHHDFAFFDLFIPLGSNRKLNLRDKAFLELGTLHGGLERSSVVGEGLAHLLGLDKLKGVGNLGGFVDFFVAGLELSVEDVLEERVVEQDRLLHHDTKLLAQGRHVH